MSSYFMVETPCSGKNTDPRCGDRIGFDGLLHITYIHLYVCCMYTYYVYIYILLPDKNIRKNHRTDSEKIRMGHNDLFPKIASPVSRRIGIEIPLFGRFQRATRKKVVPRLLISTGIVEYQ